MNKNIGIIIIDKMGSVKSTIVKEYSEQDLYKKCAFKSSNTFEKQCQWSLKVDHQQITVKVFAKTVGKAGTENKYEFPPPIDSTLFFGSCAVVCSKNKDSEMISLTCENWNKIYEKLYGGFEDLASTALEDEEEEDELANVPAHMKTKEGYLKDGFVVDSEYVSIASDSASDSELSEEEYQV